MLTKEEIQTLIVCKVLAARGESQNHILNHVSGQVRAWIGVIASVPPPYNDYLPDLLDMAEIPFIDEEYGDISFDRNWMIERGFDLSDPQNPKHPKFDNEDW